MRNSDYLFYRKTKRTVKYKLRKRTEMMLKMIKKFKNKDGLSILDVGAADGLMLEQFKDKLKADLCLGIEPSLEFIQSKTKNSCPIIQALGESLPFKSNVFDVITAASVLDHMRNPSLFLQECRRVLKNSGIVIVSLVSPFYDKLSVRFNIKDDDHLLHFSDEQLEEFLKKEGFSVLEVSRFALPFFGVFLEGFIEKIFNFTKFKWPMFYIAAIAQVK